MKKRILFPIAIALILTLTMLAGCVQQGNASGADTEAGLSPGPGINLPDTGAVILRVNPEILVAYNKEGLVTKIEGLNDDGTKIVNLYTDYIGKGANTVVKDLVRVINNAGYFVSDIDGAARSVTIQIEPGSVLPTDDFLNTLASDVQTTVAELNTGSGVVGIGPNDYDTRYTKENAPSRYITRDKAAEIALSHAGVLPADAVFDDREFDFEHNRAVYELEFMSGGQEYEYDIDAVTGQILRQFIGDSGCGGTNDMKDSYYGTSFYNDTDYGPHNDGITDYNDTDYGPYNDGVTDYNNTDYGPNSDGITDYHTPAPAPAPSGYGATDYNNSGYGNSGYSNSGYGNSGYGNS